MKRAFFVLLLALALAPAGFSQDSPVVVVVNVDRVYLTCSQGQKLGQKLVEFEKTAQAEAQADVDKAKALQAKLSDKNTPAAQKASIQTELEEIALKLKRFQDDKTREAKKLEAEGLREIESKLTPIMNQMAKDNGWDLMLNRVSSIVIMAGPKADVTDKVIAAMNQAHP